MNFIAEHFEQIISFIRDIVIVGFVGGLIKYLDYLRDKRKDQLTEKTKEIEAEIIQRKEFREEIDQLRAEAKERSEHYEQEIRALYKQLDDWKDKYYKLFEKYTQLISSNSELRNKYGELLLMVKNISNDKK